MFFSNSERRFLWSIKETFGEHIRYCRGTQKLTCDRSVRSDTQKFTHERSVGRDNQKLTSENSVGSDLQFGKGYSKVVSSNKIW